MSLKYGDPDYNKRPLERELEPDEVAVVLAEYQKWGDFTRAARAVNTTEEIAFAVVEREAKANPAILSDPTPLLTMGLTMRQIAVDCFKSARKRLEKVYGKPALFAGSFAEQKAEAYFKAYQERRGADASDLDEDKVDGSLKDADEELRRLEAAAANTDSEAPEDRDAAEEAVASDVGDQE